MSEDRITIFARLGQFKRHVYEVCAKRIEKGDDECSICPFRPYVDAFLKKKKISKE